MERRNFLKKFALGGTAVATVGLLSGCDNSSNSGQSGTEASDASVPSPAVMSGKRDLKMVTTWPRDFPGLGTGAQRVADRITAMTDGRLNVKLHAAGELVGALESFDTVSQGNADMWHGAAYYWQGKSKAFNFFTAVPFGLTASELEAWMHFGGGQELWDELGAQFNIKPMLAGNTGVQMGGWFRKEVNTADDFKGLKFRMPGLGGEVLRKLGAAVVTLPGGELYPSLQSGAIDGTEWVGPWNDLAMGFYRVAKYYYHPGFHEPGSGLECSWNLDTWNSLSASDQAIVKAACNAENDVMLAEYNARNGDSLSTLVNEHGVQLRQFSDELYKSFGEAAGDVLSDMAKEDDITRRTYESFANFRKKAIEWTKLSDQSYTEKRQKFLPL